MPIDLHQAFFSGVGGPNIALIVLAAVVIIGLFKAVKIVPQSQNWVVERMGKYRATLPAGLHLIIPLIDHVRHKVDVLERPLPVEELSVITSENAPLMVHISTFYRVLQPEFTVYRIRDIDAAVMTTVTGTVRSIIGGYDFDSIQAKRSEINHKLIEDLAATAEEWGIAITRCEIVDVDFDPTTREAMHKQMNAERERRAVIAKAEGEKRAAELAADAELYVAQKKADARRIQAAAEAEATRLVGEAIATNGKEAAAFEIAKQQVNGLSQVAASPNAKLVVIPYEGTSAFNVVSELINFSREK